MLTLYLTEQTRDGESQPDETLVFTRIKSTTREDFEEFCKLAEGRWTTEITLDEDVPGFGKKGETIVGHMNHALTTNGSAMIGRHNFGEGWVTELKTYDPQSKEIITTQAMSDGTIGHIREHKSHGEWAVKNTEIMPDGTKSESIGTTVFSEDGETWTIKFGSIGQEEDEWSMSVWRRISK